MAAYKNLKTINPAPFSPEDADCSKEYIPRSLCCGVVDTASLYLHIPFCASFCDYCDFYSEEITAQAGRIDAYIEALLTDIEYQLAFFNVKKIPSIYIGGGTPSVIGAFRMENFLAKLQRLFTVTGNILPQEFTVEANPESLTEDFLRICLAGGVTRISLGLQSFHEPSRRAVNRKGEACFIKTQLALTARYYPDNFSVDLMSGLPFQNKAVLLNDIEQTLTFKPAHLSLYSLTVEDETPLAQNLTRGINKEFFPAFDETDALWLCGREALCKAGYEHYEVSNFAMPAKRCAHNTRYWRMENWLGAGPAASGTIIDEKTGTGKRYTYTADLDAYLAAPKPAFQSAVVEELDKAALIKESLLMGFRFCGGPDMENFKRRFGRSIEECIPQTIRRWKERGVFINGADTLVPCGKMLLVLDSFLRDAFIELDN